jgi:hypothetical protein
MKLWNRCETPVGGWMYFDPTFQREIRVDTNLEDLAYMAARLYEANGYEVPPHLIKYIEEVICDRQPPGRCMYERKLGDGVALIVNKAAKAIDHVLKTELEQKTRGCSGCGQRRRYLNRSSLTRR